MRFEEWPWRETKHSREKVRREGADGDVVILHRSIEVPAFNGNAVLGSFQLGLEILEILGGAQFRVALAHHQQARKCVAQLSLRRLKFLQFCRVGWSVIGIDLHPPDAGASIRHFRQCRFLKICRALNGVDQVRNQIGAALIDILHLGPALINLLLERDQSIIAGGDSTSADQHNEKKNGTDAKTTKKAFIHMR